MHNLARILISEQDHYHHPISLSLSCHNNYYAKSGQQDHLHNSYLPVIGVHEMHGRMHPNYCQITILLVVDLRSPLVYFMMTQPLPIAGKLPIKLWLLSNYQQAHMHSAYQSHQTVHDHHIFYIDLFLCKILSERALNHTMVMS